MRRIANRDIFKHNVTIIGRPPRRRVDSTWWFLLEVEKLDDPLDGDEVHLKLAVTLAKAVGIADD